MTTLAVSRTGGNIQELSVSGHAGFAHAGRDIVCAAVSVLMTTGVNALESVAGIQPDLIRDEQNALMTLKLPKGMTEVAKHDAQIILRTVLQGFEDIAQAYPKHLKIMDGRTSSC